jgi:hypothetical protein
MEFFHAAERISGVVGVDKKSQLFALFLLARQTKHH